jgi:DNA repair protein RecO (recombination protein O)
MTKTYKATGIILNRMPLGENDRLVTILTPEYGLIRAVAPGARKYKSRLRGRSELFVVNELLLVKGRSLDKITQAETQESYPKLSQNLGKLTVSQYLAELVLCLGLSDQPQMELYSLFNEHLRRIERLPPSQNLFPYLAQAVFHLLAIAGIVPQVHTCCFTQKSLIANFQDPYWKVGFSFSAGGLISLSAPELKINKPMNQEKINQINTTLGALELTLLQNLSQKVLPENGKILPVTLNILSIDRAWIKVERMLKEYVEFYLGRSVRSAEMINDVLLEF